jgi:hypothetical protein
MIIDFLGRVSDWIDWNLILGLHMSHPPLFLMWFAIIWAVAHLAVSLGRRSK